jgi:hypothetical protein
LPPSNDPNAPEQKIGFIDIPSDACLSASPPANCAYAAADEIDMVATNQPMTPTQKGNAHKFSLVVPFMNGTAAECAPKAIEDAAKITSGKEPEDIGGPANFFLHSPALQPPATEVGK